MSIYLEDSVRETSAQTWIQFLRDVVPSFMHSCRRTRKFVFSRMLDQLWLFCLAGYLVPSLPVGMLLWHEISGHTGNHPQINSPTGPLPPARHHMSCCEIWRWLIPQHLFRWFFFSCFRNWRVPKFHVTKHHFKARMPSHAQMVGKRMLFSEAYAVLSDHFSGLVRFKFDDVTVWIATWPFMTEA